MILTLVAACSGDAAHPGKKVAAQDAFTADFALDLGVPAVVRATWANETQTLGRIAWLGDGSADWRASAWEDAAGLVHERELVGLHADERVVVRPEMWSEEDGLMVGEEQLITTPGLPSDLPVLTLNASDGTTQGYVLTHFLSDRRDSVVVLDRLGQPVWYVVPDSDDRILSVEPSIDRKSVWFAQHPTDYTASTGRVWHIALDATVQDSIELERVHSGVAELPEGGFGYIYKAEEPYGTGTVFFDEIWEYDGEGNSQQIFSLRDWFQPQPMCECFDLQVMGDDQPDGEYYDWTHANSLVLSEDGTAWYLMVRYFDAIMKVDRATGDLLWVMGGPYGEFKFEGPDPTFLHGHMSQIGDNQALVFDNGTHRQYPPSRVMLYRYDEEARTVTAEREIREPDDGYISMLGDAVLGDNGDVLISWTTRGLLQRVDSDDELRWEVGTAMGAYTGRVKLLDEVQDISDTP